MKAPGSRIAVVALVVVGSAFASVHGYAYKAHSQIEAQDLAME